MDNFKSILYIPLKVVRKVLELIRFNDTIELRNWKMFSDKNYSNELIYNMIIRDEPCMIGRLGSTELLSLTNYIGVKENKKNITSYIRGKTLPWWWEPKSMDQLRTHSGFFPVDD